MIRPRCLVRSYYEISETFFFCVTLQVRRETRVYTVIRCNPIFPFEPSG